MGTLANSDDPYEMPHNVAFHQCLHCLLEQNLYCNTMLLYGKFHWSEKGL